MTEEVKKTGSGRLVIVRHGQSDLNEKNVFTGWLNSQLTDLGKDQATVAGNTLKEIGFKPSVMFTTSLDRASETGDNILKAMGIGKGEVETIIDNRLIERHYGDLTGKNKAQLSIDLIDGFKKQINSVINENRDGGLEKLINDEIGRSQPERAQKIINILSSFEKIDGKIDGVAIGKIADEMAKARVNEYRRAYDVPPPEMKETNPHHPNNKESIEEKIVVPEGIDYKETESLEDVVKRVKPFWNDVLLPKLAAGEDIMISAHGNSLRALTMIMKGMSEDQIIKYEMDNAKPFVYDITPNKVGGEWKWNIEDVAVPKTAYENAKDKLNDLVKVVSNINGGGNGDVSLTRKTKEITELKIVYPETESQVTGEQGGAGRQPVDALVSYLHKSGLITGKFPENISINEYSKALAIDNPIKIGDNVNISINSDSKKLELTLKTNENITSVNQKLGSAFTKALTHAGAEAEAVTNYIGEIGKDKDR